MTTKDDDELRQKVDDIVYRCFAQGQYWGSGLGKDPEAFNEDYRPDNPIDRTEAVEAIMHLITTHVMRARISELEALLANSHDRMPKGTQRINGDTGRVEFMEDHKIVHDWQIHDRLAHLNSQRKGGKS